MQGTWKNIVCYLYDNGLCDTIYFTIQISALTLSHVLAVIFGKKLGLKKIKALVAVLIEVIIVYIEMFFICAIIEKIVPYDAPIMNTYYNNVVRTFVLVPFSAFLVSKLFKEDLKTICALYAFAQPVIWGLASVACPFAGCCIGIPCEWGIYNAWEQMYVFPTQFLNALLLVSAAIYIAYRVKRNQYKPDGTEYPVALILIGIIRFLTEFLMDDPKIIWGLSSFSINAVIMCFVGITALIVIRKNKRKVLL